MKAIQTKGIISSIRSKVDRSLSLTVHTPELSTKERALFMDLQGLNTELLITPEKDESAEVEKIEKDIETKSQSQRLRSVLYVYWKQQGFKEDFHEFYRTTMEKLIDHYKAKLN